MCVWLPQRPEEGPSSLVVHSMNYHVLAHELWELRAGPFGRAVGALHYPSMVLPSPSTGFVVVVVVYVLIKSIDPTTGSNHMQQCCGHTKLNYSISRLIVQA